MQETQFESWVGKYYKQRNSFYLATPLPPPAQREEAADRNVQPFQEKGLLSDYLHSLSLKGWIFFFFFGIQNVFYKLLNRYQRQAKRHYKKITNILYKY